MEYAAEGLQITLDKVWARIQRLIAEMGAKKIVLRPKQEQLLHMLRERSSLTPREIWKGLGVSKQGAMDLLPLADTVGSEAPSPVGLLLRSSLGALEGGHEGAGRGNF